MNAALSAIKIFTGLRKCDGSNHPGLYYVQVMFYSSCSMNYSVDSYRDLKELHTNYSFCLFLQ